MTNKIEVDFYGQSYLTEDWDDYDYEDLVNSVSREFSQHVGKEINITSENLGWNNASVYANFILENSEDIITKLSHSSMWDMTIIKTKNVYKVKLNDHDGTSDFVVSFEKENN